LIFVLGLLLQETLMEYFKRVALYGILGAASFWTPDIFLNARGSGSLLLFTLLPTVGFLIACLTTKKLGGSISGPSVATYMIIGVWLLGSTAMMIGASFSGGGFSSSALDTIVVIFLGLLPPYTMIMSTYDGSLFGLLLVSFLAVFAHFQFESDNWVLPPSLRLRIIRWYEAPLKKVS
jgi:hypothetical protein